MRKLTKDEVRVRAAERGFELVEYGGSTKARSRFRCKAGHEWETGASEVISSGKGCPHCYGNVRLTIEEARILVARQGFEIEAYGGSAKSKSLFRCGSGHEWGTSVSAVVNRGTGCPTCAGNAPVSEDVARARVEEKGFTLVKYGGTTQVPSLFQCWVGHEWETSVNHVVNTRTGCPHCAGKARLTEDEVRIRLAKRGFSLVEYGGGTSARSLFRCSNYHTWATSASGVMNGQSGCPPLFRHGPGNRGSCAEASGGGGV